MSLQHHQEMKIGGDIVSPDSYLLSEKQRGLVRLPHWVKRGGKSEPSFETEHMELFMEEGWPWPVTPEVFQNECGHMPHLSARAREVIFYANRKWSMPDDVSVQFLDCNCSLDRLRRVHGAWADSAPMTLVGTTQLIMRRRRSDAPGFELRYITGVELMRMQGWSLGDFLAPTLTSADNDTTTSLAGNAFSGFAVGPVLLAALPMLFASPPSHTTEVPQQTVVAPESEPGLSSDEDLSEAETSDDGHRIT